MPNLTMEYTHSVDERINIQSLLEGLHTILINSDVFEINSIKSRALCIHQWLIGDAADSIDFIHLTLDVLKGRTDTQKRMLSQALMDVLSGQAHHVESLTITIRDMDLASFSKVTHFQS